MAETPVPSSLDAGLIEATGILAALDPLLRQADSGLVLAVSGGPDSMCLMHMVAACRGLRALPPILVATVDHGLRPGSSDAAAFVLAEAAALGLPARLLVWDGAKPTRAIQERARALRYARLSGLCREIGASHLVTAHTLDDQAETVLFRLSRGSSIGGLAGMPAATDRDGVVLSRPLLCIPKARLIAACVAHGWGFLDDPANSDPRFARTRMRRLLPLLAAEQLDAPRLARLAMRAARAEEALRAAAARAGGIAERDADTGCRRLDARHLAAEPAEIFLRVVQRAVEQVGSGRPIRLERLERIAADLRAAIAARSALRRTLNGSLLALSSRGQLDIRPEGSRKRGRAAGPLQSLHLDAHKAAAEPRAAPGSLGNGERDAYIAL